jgi:adenine-specific DNA-methyltransferase
MKREELNQPFSEELFSNLNSQLINEEIIKVEESEINTNSLKFIQSAKYFGKYDLFDLHVFTADHSAGKDARVGIGLELFKIMKNNNFQNALVATYNNRENIWRYSLITSNLQIDDKGKIKKIFSNPKRYSYVMGPGAKTKTPYSFLVEKGSVSDFDNLQKRFSVEVVNNEFYNLIANLFDSLVGSDDAILSIVNYEKISKLTNVEYLYEDKKHKKHYKINRLIKYPHTDLRLYEYGVRLIGRIIFCWFLKEKKSSKGKPLLPEAILSKEAVFEKNYYHFTLAPLFFEVLNKHRDDRHKAHEKFTLEPYNSIPYLNGGLFNPDDLDEYRYDKALGVSSPGVIDIPDKWFEELFHVLEIYNFTVDENTVYDSELSIDPEMLGRVFENLLARINPETKETVRSSTGSFYTPREVVDYMADISLSQYLHQKTGIDKAKLDALVSFDLLDDIGNELDKNQKVAVLEALADLKILDPACGSGAYPIGMLQKILHIISLVDPDAQWWLNKQLESAGPELRKELSSRGTDYIRKLGIIRQSIFGVDIQPIATEISRLRCFLTLIVDEVIDDTKDDMGIKPLPNLDFKFVTADTLISLDTDNDQTILVDDKSDYDELSGVMSEYFVSDVNERDGIKYRFTQLQKKIYEKQRSFGVLADNSKTAKLAAWDPFETKQAQWFDPQWMFGMKDKFDIVIGNPPYIQLQKDGGYLAEKYKDSGYDTFARTGDIYALFYERGLELTKENSGLLCYITSNKWMRAGYGKLLRQFMANHNPLKLVDLGGDVFETATVDTNIILLNNNKGFRGLHALDLSNVKNIPSFSNYKDDWIVIEELNSNAWFIGSKIEFSIKKKIEEKGRPLEDWDISINRGILTGYNEAFIIDSKTKEKLCEEDPRSADIIKPILRGRDISRYSAHWEELWLIATFPSMKINIDEYPAVKHYLLSFGKDRLGQTGSEFIDSNGTKQKSRKKSNNKWFETQDQIAYYEEFEKEKIIWGNIAYNSSFTFDKNNFVNAPANLLTAKGVNIKFLLGIMNSKIFSWEFSSLGITLGKAFEWKKQYVEQIHIPMADENSQKDIVELVDKVLDITTAANYNPEELPASQIEYEKAIDKIVYKLYGLNAEEIELLEKPSRP